MICHRSLAGILIVFSVLLNQCKSKVDEIDYFGEKPPGDTAVIFAPGSISKKGRLERVPTFSPNGKELFFTVTTPDWAPTILYSNKNNGRWSIPDTAFFAKEYNNTEPFFSPDGQKLYFASNRPPGSPPWNANIWMIERTEGAWTQPQYLGNEVNSTVSDYHTAVANNGTLYFASTRDAQQNGPDIYRSVMKHDQYQKPANLGDSINSIYQEWDPFIAPDESFIIFKSDRPGGYGNMDLYVSYNTQDDTWTAAENLGAIINTKWHDDAGAISPDGKYLFFARRTDEGEMDIYWIDAKVVYDLNPIEQQNN